MGSQRAEAYETALLNHISNLETRASAKLQERADIDHQHEQHVAEDARAEAIKRARQREHAAVLLEQIQAKKERSHTQSARKEFELQRCSAPPLAATANEKPETGWGEAISEGGPSVSATAASASRPPNAFRDALDAQVHAKRQKAEKRRALERRFENAQVEADNEELHAFRQFEKGSRASERLELEAAWREELRLKEVFKSIERSAGKRGSGSHSSRGTPRAQLLPGSARGTGCGPDALGAAASLALQIRPVAVV